MINNLLNKISSSYNNDTVGPDIYHIPSILIYDVDAFIKHIKKYDRSIVFDRINPISSFVSIKQYGKCHTILEYRTKNNKLIASIQSRFNIESYDGYSLIPINILTEKFDNKFGYKYIEYNEMLVPIK